MEEDTLTPSAILEKDSMAATKVHGNGEEGKDIDQNNNATIELM